jgi:hypothetical protein
MVQEIVQSQPAGHENNGAYESFVQARQSLLGDVYALPAGMSSGETPAGAKDSKDQRTLKDSMVDMVKGGLFLSTTEKIPGAREMLDGEAGKWGQKQKDPQEEERKFKEALKEAFGNSKAADVNLNPYNGMSYLEALDKLGLPRPVDPGFSGGIKQIERDLRSQALFEKHIVDGVPYQEARQRAGLPRDVDPGFSGGAGAIAERTRSSVRLEQLILQGVPYQVARQKAGLGRDTDPGFSGGERAIEQRIRERAMLKRFMLYGEDRKTWQH